MHIEEQLSIFLKTFNNVLELLHVMLTIRIKVEFRKYPSMIVFYCMYMYQLSNFV